MLKEVTEFIYFHQLSLLFIIYENIPSEIINDEDIQNDV